MHLINYAYIIMDGKMVSGCVQCTGLINKSIYIGISNNIRFKKMRASNQTFLVWTVLALDMDLEM